MIPSPLSPSKGGGCPLVWPPALTLSFGGLAQPDGKEGQCREGQCSRSEAAPPEAPSAPVCPRGGLWTPPTHRPFTGPARGRRPEPRSGEQGTNAGGGEPREGCLVPPWQPRHRGSQSTAGDSVTAGSGGARRRGDRSWPPSPSQPAPRPGSARWSSRCCACFSFFLFVFIPNKAWQ